MRLLKIDESQGYFLNTQDGFTTVDKITKDDLLRLVGLSLDASEVEYDEFDMTKLKNHAHQIIYKSVFEKLRDLRNRREEFKDMSGRLYLTEFEKYRNTPQPNPKTGTDN